MDVSLRTGQILIAFKQEVMPYLEERLVSQVSWSDTKFMFRFCWDSNHLCLLLTSCLSLSQV